MYATPALYSRALRADEKKVVPFVSLGVGVDHTAADDITSIKGDFLPLSNISQITDANYVMTPGLATFEADGIPTAPSQQMVVPPIQATAYPPEAGVWSRGISDASGNISWTLDVKLSKAHTSAFSIYTDTIHILEGKLTYYLNNEIVRDVTIQATSETFQDTEITTYDRVVFTSVKIDQPFHHIRIVEIEFGASLTLSSTVLGESLSYISEYDPLGISCPISELDFSLLNVEGEYDPDNPNTLLSKVGKWFPLTLSFTVYEETGQVTVPMGRLYITERKGTDTLLKIIAQDARAILQSTYTPIALKTTESIGLMYETLLTELGIPYVIEDGAYQVMPDADVTMDDQDRDLLTQSLYIQQYYGVRLIPGRDGFLHVSTDAVGETVPTITADLVISYPTPSEAKSYNFISVSYKDGTTSKTYMVDLSTDSTVAKSAVSINNPLVRDEANAQRLAQALQASLYSQEYSAEAIGDASIDAGDTIPIEGRWTQGSPDSYRSTSIEWKWDGSFLMTVKGVR